MILKKLGDEYKLYSHDSCIATTYESPYQKLSLKNCQAIENGYDLDDMAEKYFLQKYSWTGVNHLPYKEEDVRLIKENFVAGAKAILEILGDKKYDETNLYRAFLINSAGNNTTLRNFFEQTVLPMFQDNEWEVDIEMEYQGFKKDYKPIEAYLPKLDANGCLILKLK